MVQTKVAILTESLSHLNLCARANLLPNAW